MKKNQFHLGAFGSIKLNKIVDDDIFFLIRKYSLGALFEWELNNFPVKSKCPIKIMENRCQLTPTENYSEKELEWLKYITELLKDYSPNGEIKFKNGKSFKVNNGIIESVKEE